MTEVLMKQNATGDTILMDLADRGKLQLLVGHMHDLLVTTDELKEYVNKANEYGNTALMLAANHNHYSIVDILIKAGADVTLTNSAGQDAASLANKQDFQNIVDLLVFNGATRPAAIVVELDKVEEIIDNSIIEPTLSETTTNETSID